MDTLPVAVTFPYASRVMRYGLYESGCGTTMSFLSYGRGSVAKYGEGRSEV